MNLDGPHLFNQWEILGPILMGPNPKFQATWGQSVWSPPLREHESWDLPHHKSYVPSVTWIPTWHQLSGDETRDLCWESTSPKRSTQRSTQPLQMFVHKIIKIILTIYSHDLLRLKSHVRTWEPIHVNRPVEWEWNGMQRSRALSLEHVWGGTWLRRSEHRSKSWYVRPT